MPKETINLCHVDRLMMRLSYEKRILVCHHHSSVVLVQTVVIVIHMFEVTVLILKIRLSIY